MATVGSSWSVSGLTQATPNQSPGQLSAASSTSGSTSTPSAGDYLITKQSLSILYRLIPRFGFNLDHSLSLSGYAFAAVPTAGTSQSVWNTRMMYQADAWVSREKVTGAFAGSYSRPQTFTVQPHPAPDDGGDAGSYGSTLTSGTLGPAGVITTSSTYYDRRPWVTGDTELAQYTTQFNFFPSVSSHPFMSDTDKNNYTSSVENTINMFNDGEDTYTAFNSPRNLYRAGLPTTKIEQLSVPIYVNYKWGPYDPGAQTLLEVSQFIDRVGDYVRTGHNGVPSMIPHGYTDSHGNPADLHRIPEYSTSRHSFV